MYDVPGFDLSIVKKLWLLFMYILLRAYTTPNGLAESHDTLKILQQSFLNKYMSYVRRQHVSTKFSR